MFNDKNFARTLNFHLLPFERINIFVVLVWNLKNLPKIFYCLSFTFLLDTITAPHPNSMQILVLKSFPFFLDFLSCIAHWRNPTRFRTISWYFSLPLIFFCNWTYSCIFKSTTTPISKISSRLGSIFFVFNEFNSVSIKCRWIIWNKLSNKLGFFFLFFKENLATKYYAEIVYLIINNLGVIKNINYR